MAEKGSLDKESPKPQLPQCGRQPNNAGVWRHTAYYQRRPEKPTMWLTTDEREPETRISTNERSVLLPKPCSVSPINGVHDDPDHDSDYRRKFFDEVKILARYTLPVFACVSHFQSHTWPTSYLETEPMYWRYVPPRAIQLDIFGLTLSFSTHSLSPVPSPSATSRPQPSDR